MCQDFFLMLNGRVVLPTTPRSIYCTKRYLKVCIADLQVIKKNRATYHGVFYRGTEAFRVPLCSDIYLAFYYYYFKVLLVFWDMVVYTNTRHTGRIQKGRQWGGGLIGGRNTLCREASSTQSRCSFARTS